MSAWSEIELDKLFDFSSGKSIVPGGDGAFPAFGSNGLIGRSPKALFEAGIIIGRVGAYCGSTAISTSPFWASDNTIVAVPKKNVDLGFGYFLLTNAGLNRYAGGSAQPLLTQSVLKPLRFKVPSPPMQRRIASILESYNDLIEVNRRRIATLRGMAQRVFDEAVRAFRAERSKGTLAASLVEKTLGGDWGSETATSDETQEVRIIRGTDFRRVQSGDFSTAPTRFISPQSTERRLLRPFDVIVENSINAKTRNAGTPLLVSAGSIDAFGGSVITASFCRLFRCTSPENALVLFHYLDWLQRCDEMQRFQVVATNGIANFQTEQFMKRAIIPLSLETIEPLGARLAPFAVTTFQEQIFNLTRQRDLLVPRLISGDLPVSATAPDLEAVA